MKTSSSNHKLSNVYRFPLFSLSNSILNFHGIKQFPASIDSRSIRKKIKEKKPLHFLEIYSNITINVARNDGSGNLVRIGDGSVQLVPFPDITTSRALSELASSMFDELPTSFHVLVERGTGVFPRDLHRIFSRRPDTDLASGFSA